MDVRTNPTARDQGKWREHPYFPGVEVCVRSANSKAFEDRQSDLWAERTGSRRISRKRSQRMARAILREAADALIDGEAGGWKGITDAGVEVPYTPERAREWARDPQYEDFYRGVLELSDLRAQEEAEEREESLGN